MHDGATPGHGGHEGLITAAVEVADHHGFNLGSPLSISAAAEAAGVSRSTVYRHWQNRLELGDDVARYAIVEYPGWQRRLLDVPPTEPVGAAVADLLVHGAAREVGLLFRAHTAQLHETFGVRADARDWEQRWLRAFARWLRARAAAEGRVIRRDPTELALALAALVEGALLAAVTSHGLTYEGWPPEEARAVGVAFDALIRRSTGPLAAGIPRPPAEGGGPPVDLPGLDWDPARRDLVAAILAGTAARHVRGDAPAAFRLVSPELLAEHLGVTARWVYKATPSTAGFNADVVEAIIRRDMARNSAIVDDALRRCLAAPPAEHPGIVSDMVDDLLGPGDRRGRKTYLDCVFPGRHPEVARRSAEVYAEWRVRQQIQLLALLQATGAQVRPEFTWGEVLTLTFGTGLGAARLLTTGVPTGEPTHDRGAARRASLSVLGALVEARPDLPS